VAKWNISNVGGDEFIFKNSATTMYCSEAGRYLRCNNYHDGRTLSTLALSYKYRTTGPTNNFLRFIEQVPRTPVNNTNMYIGSISKYYIALSYPSDNISVHTLTYSETLSLQSGTISPWDTNYGTFTTPSAGSYLIVASFLVKQSEFHFHNNPLIVCMYINNVFNSNVLSHQKQNGGRLYNFTSTNKLNANDKVYFSVKETKAQIIIQFGTPSNSKSNITFTKIN